MVTRAYSCSNSRQFKAVHRRFATGVVKKGLIDGKPFCIFVILSTAVTCLAINAAAGLAVGILLEQGRRTWAMLAMR